jgi:hypothetical protein
LQADQLPREPSYPIDVTAAPPKVHPQVAAIGPTQARKRLNERRDESLRQGTVFVEPREHADAPHAVALLRARRERPRRRRAAPRRLISSIGFLRTELSKLGRSQPLCARLKG